jgi:hypothetical protein
MMIPAVWWVNLLPGMRLGVADSNCRRMNLTWLLPVLLMMNAVLKTHSEEKRQPIK